MLKKAQLVKVTLIAITILWSLLMTLLVMLLFQTKKLSLNTLLLNIQTPLSEMISKSEKVLNMNSLSVQKLIKLVDMEFKEN